MLRILRSQTCLFHVFSCFCLFLPSQVNTCSFAQNAEHMGSLQRAQWQFSALGFELVRTWRTRLFTEKGGSQNQARQDTQHIWVQFIFFKTILPSDTLGGGFKDWNRKSRLPIFFQEKSCIWPHCDNMSFFSRGLNTTKIRPGQTRSILNLKMKHIQSEIHSFNHQLLHLKSSLLHDRCHCEKRDFWMASPAEATENRSGSTWGHTVGGLEGESIPRGVVMMCRKNTSEIYFCEINIIMIMFDFLDVIWWFISDFDVLCVILYIMMIIGELMMVVPPWCLPRWISHQELGTAFAAREEEIEDELLEPSSASPGWNQRWSIGFFW